MIRFASPHRAELQPGIALVILLFWTHSTVAFSIDDVTVLPTGTITPSDPVSIEFSISTPSEPPSLYQPTEVHIAGHNISVDLFVDSGSFQMIGTLTEIVDLGELSSGNYTYTAVLHPGHESGWGIRRVTGTFFVECLGTPTIAPLTGPTGSLPKSRYISIVPGNAGVETALRITLTQLSDFDSFVDEYRWVGPPGKCPEENQSDPGVTLVASNLQCQPYFHDWSTVDVLHVYGAEVLPDSAYALSAVAFCADSSDAESYTDPLVVVTAKWGDVVLPYADDDNGTIQPDFGDVAGVVSKFLAEPTAPTKPHAQLQPNYVLPDRPIDFKDITAAVDAFLGVSYAASISATGPCTCPSSVVCGATSCTSDSQCGDGFCINAFCTDACGRCSP